ncbi:trichohyalin [Coccinella septempunctata]|uniref:trichohyalin n=1 Tax=Coccinella septempunctata TaxID=41139 RepID=UPI001D099508|nr:trichohyalin [Coccinella septempunctata]
MYKVVVSVIAVLKCGRYCCAFCTLAYDDKSISLIERKKRQWAREKDELDNLWAPWENRTSNQWPLSSRAQHTKIATIVGQSSNRRESFSSQNSYKKSSLPPLSKTQTISKDRFEREGETSGYASDNPVQPGYLSRTYSGNPSNPQCGYESSSSRDDRSRWKNKVMSSDWESKDTSRSNEITNDPPNWLKRGLEQEGHIEVTNSSPSESPEQDYIEHDRPLTGSSSVRIRTHIRGQNIRLDSVELAERERKREIALQHQQAIRQQLEERERKRSEERRRRIREEYEEELRIAKEQQLERKRLEDEQKLLQKKHEKEEKRKEAMKKAIELAENEAKLQKMKLKMLKQQKNNDPSELYPIETPTKECNSNRESKLECTKEKSNLTPRNTSHTRPDEKNKENWNNMQPTKIENRTTEISIKNNLETENGSKDIQNNLNDNMKNFSRTTQQKNEPVTIVIPTNFETLQNFQYAVLMSLPSSSSVPVAVPLAVASENTQLYTAAAARTENRILTPTQYRQKNKLMCDSSTQTEDLRIEKFSRDKNTNIDGIYENRSRKGRNSSRNENVSDRPKWGANRPPTRYLKQSEKDLVYQRKKSRQKNEENLYDDKNSSDESQMGTPRYRKRNHLDKRHPRPMWRKHNSEDVFRRNVRMYQSEIIPIEADKNNVCFEHRCCCKCRCSGKRIVESSVDILTVNHESPRNTTGSNLIDDPNRTGDDLPSLPNEEMD